MYARRLPYARPGSLGAKQVAETACRLCERPWTLRRPTRHRLVPGRYGGKYEAANVVPLCWPCHDAVERDLSARRMLRPRLWPIEVAHVIARMGRPWLDRNYPVPAMSQTPQALAVSPHSVQRPPCERQMIQAR